MIELYRCIIPASKLINDNVGTHYKAHQGKIDWLTHQFIEILNGETKTPGDFRIPDLEKVKSQLGETVHIRCEVWRCTNILFDPQNYAKTFKAPIDLLVKRGFIPDDNWKFVDGIMYCGGGYDAWSKRAIRYEGDGLPEQLDPKTWWKQHSDDYNDVMIRVFVK